MEVKLHIYVTHDVGEDDFLQSTTIDKVKYLGVRLLDGYTLCVEKLDDGSISIDLHYADGSDIRLEHIFPKSDV